MSYVLGTDLVIYSMQYIHVHMHIRWQTVAIPPANNIIILYREGYVACIDQLEAFPSHVHVQSSWMTSELLKHTLY